MLRRKLVITGLSIFLPMLGNSWAGEMPSSDVSSAQQRVATALHAAPYFYDKHVQVSVQGNAVVLNGFVASAWDLQEAERIATEAAKPVKIIDSLTIKEGGNR